MINLKFAKASEASKINKYKDKKINVFNYKANIFCNKKYITRSFIPKWVSITVTDKFEAAKH